MKDYSRPLNLRVVEEVEREYFGIKVAEYLAHKKREYQINETLYISGERGMTPHSVRRERVNSSFLVMNMLRTPMGSHPTSCILNFRHKKESLKLMKLSILAEREALEPFILACFIKRTVKVVMIHNFDLMTIEIKPLMILFVSLMMDMHLSK